MEGPASGGDHSTTFLFWHLRTSVLECVEEREGVNNVVRLQDVGSNLSMIKLV